MERPLTHAPIAVTMGEPAGIGSEITLKAWAARISSTPSFFVVGDAARLQDVANRFRINCPVLAIDAPSKAAEVFKSALPVLPLARKIETAVILGNPTPETASAVIGAIEQAVELVGAGEASAIVTNPIQKAALLDADFPFPGHTEFLGHLSGCASPVMMLAVEGLRVVPVTVHVAVKNIARDLTTDAIIHCGNVAAQALQLDFDIQKPRIAVAALNPHAGEQGRLGDEEISIISPAISHLKGKGIDIHGPAPSDTLFHEVARRKFDAVLCMYHDQALIPLKTIDFANGVNVTLGLPFVRTSPDHGTACDIATQGIADPSSLLAALRMASDIATSRTRNL
jgi:4-hydroxythreonine-4-phosphate dehydrogenase